MSGVTVGLISDGELTRLEALADVEHVMPRLTMSASSAAPVSSAETTVKTSMKTVAEPTVQTINEAAVETMNEAAVETVDEAVVKMRKPLHYYDRRPEPE